MENEQEAAQPADARGQISWTVFEWARNPFVILITIYIFAPYFAHTVVGDPTLGQSYWARMNWVGAFIIALMAPVLGAVADAMGRRKPWIGFFVVILAIGSWGLWFARPEGMGLSVLAIAGVVILCNLAFEFSAVFHNAMLPAIARGRRMASLSGLGLALGNAGALLILVAMLSLVALPGVVDWPFVAKEPWFGLDRDLFEPSRSAGPVVAMWLLIFSAPLFLFTPDQKATGVKVGTAIHGSLAQVRSTVLKLKHYRNVAIYLFARMLYNDGKTAILVIGGVYASGTFGWGFLEMLIYGITLTIFAVLGGLLGGVLDNWLGSQRAIMVSIGGTSLGLLLALSVTPTELFFVPYESKGPVIDLPFFNTLPELTYVGIVILIAIFITAAYANSRTMLARIAPREMMGEFFGLYALSGSVTAFMGTALVDFSTTLFNSSRIGFGSVLLLLGAGLGLMFFVKPERSTLAPEDQ
ncbi:MAG: MFS transporter [Alphaproteobacteria bacterium]|nr:MAG: MFS transporter [Alphaproteobacteria bacterium]